MGLFRLTPEGPVQSYKTYGISMPLATHFRKARCEEVDCAQLEFGWLTRIDEASPVGGLQAHYIRTQSGRHFTEAREGALTVFTFPAGQQCFGGHRVPIGRPALFLVRGGDWRGDPGGIPGRTHSSAESWRDDFATHQQTIADQVEKG